MVFKYKLIGLIASFAVLVAACGSSSSSNAEHSISTTNDSTRLTPVETQSPNVDYQPAFEGQTRIGGVKTNTNYSATVLTDGLSNPWGIIDLPDGRFLIT